MAGILDDLFEDLVKEPETKDENPPEDDKPESVKSALFPTSKEWEEFREQHKSGA